MFALGSFEESEAPAWGFPLALSLSQRLQWREGSILRQSGKERSKDYSRSAVGGGLITKLLFNDVCCFGNWLPVRRTLWITDWVSGWFPFDSMHILVPGIRHFCRCPYYKVLFLIL